MHWVRLLQLNGLISRDELSKSIIADFPPGPQDDPDDCGMPILCIFYCLIFIILCLSIYTTIKGTRGE